MTNMSHRYFISKVIKNQPIGQRYFTLTINALTDMPVPIPGQFCMIKVSDTIQKGSITSLDTFLGRPLCIFDFRDGMITFLIRITGHGTQILSKLTVGEEVSILGPLGNGFPLVKDSQLPIIVVGGMGIASVYMFINKYGASALFYGAKTASELLFLDHIKDRCNKIFVATDDGTAGETGSIVDTLERNIDNRLIYCCGPNGMYNAMAERFKGRGLDIKISLEERMACGIGACLGCVVKSTDGYICICKEGPVVDLYNIYKESTLGL